MRVENETPEKAPILDMTPDEISRLLNEDLEPGTLGLRDKEDVISELHPSPAGRQAPAPGAGAAPAPGAAARPAPAAAPAGAKAAAGGPAPVDANRAMATVDALAQHMDRFADDLQKAAQTGDARSARLRLGELLGAVNQAKKEVDALCTQLGLPEVSY